MEYAIAIVATVVLPVLLGWLRGRHNVDPNTVEGRAYYRSEQGE
jgi:hypothetical protein